jgi:hypothetical protein
MVKQIKLNALDQCNPSFQTFGLWAHPRDQALDYTTRNLRAVTIFIVAFLCSLV